METTLTKTMELSREAQEPLTGNAGAAMKVTNENNVALRSARNESVENRGTAISTDAGLSGRAADRVELSVNLKEVEKLTAAVAALPDSNSGKIESIRNRIANGTYRVSGLAVAEKMLNSMGISIPKGDE